jgi:hypothetical protein
MQVLHQQFSICFCAESRPNINNKNKTILESFPLLYLAASKKKAAASKDVDVESLKVPALLSPIAQKPYKGKALVRPRSATKLHSLGLEKVVGAKTEKNSESPS